LNKWEGKQFYKMCGLCWQRLYYLAMRGRMIMNWKGCGSNHGLNRDNIPAPAWKDWGKLI
jgi:cytochrome c551/c552